MQERLELMLDAVNTKIGGACSKKTLKNIEEVGTTFGLTITPPYNGRSEVRDNCDIPIGISRSVYLIGWINERDELIKELAK